MNVQLGRDILIKLKDINAGIEYRTLCWENIAWLHDKVSWNSYLKWYVRWWDNLKNDNLEELCDKWDKQADELMK